MDKKNVKIALNLSLLNDSMAPNGTKSEISLQFYDRPCEKLGVNYAGLIVVERKKENGHPMDILLPGER